MFGELHPEEIDQLLRRQRIGRLGVSGDGNTYIFPVVYAYDGVYAYVVSHDGLKVQLLRRDPQVCLEVDEISTPVNWRSVMLHGVFEEVADKRERERAVAAIAGSAEFAFPERLSRALERGSEIVVYRIRIHERTGRYEQHAS